MTLRKRKFLGILLTIAWMVIYSLIAMVVGSIFVLGHGTALELPFYIAAGLAWIPLEMVIIKWMSKPDAT